MGLKNYTDEQEKELIKLYIDEEREIKDIGKILDKTDRSLVSKLVNMKIYNIPIKKPKEPRIQAKHLINELENLLNITLKNYNHSIMTPNLAQKENLTLILDAIKNLPNQN